MASPHPRGWTRAVGPDALARRGFPAPAGMDPAVGRSVCADAGLPRTRGDGPRRSTVPPRGTGASPHPRGWTRGRAAVRHRHGGFPAPAGMDPRRGSIRHSNSRLPRTRGDGPRREGGPADAAQASPHPRGWTQDYPPPVGQARGFPAPAGMDPCTRRFRSSTRWLPRTRGDGPWSRLGADATYAASPHPRGWTPHVAGRPVSSLGFPAPAGMDRRSAGTP